MRSKSWPLVAVALLLAGLVGESAQSQPPSAAPAAEIVGRVETHDNTVIGIAVPGEIAPAAGDPFEVFLTTPGGERGRVGRGKITFAKNGVALGRLDEATGELAAGQEVRIQLSNSQRRAAAPPAPAPVEPPATVTPAPASSVSTSAAPPADAAKLPGLFVSDDPRFPFVLQVEARGDSVLVRGMGRMAYSSDDPTPIVAEFSGIGRAGDKPALRGVLELQPDGVRLKEKKLSPWVGLYDPANDDWQMMLSPKHVVGASRPGAAAKRNGKLGSTSQTGAGSADIVPSQNNLFTAANIAAQSSSAAIGAALAADRARTSTEPVGATARDGLPALYDQALVGLKGLGATMAQMAAAKKSGSGGPASPPGSDANFDAAMGFFIHLHQMQLIPRSDFDSEWLDGAVDAAAARTRPAPAGATLAPVSPNRGATRTTPVAPTTSIAPAAARTNPPTPSGSSSPSNAAPVVPPAPANAADPLVGRSLNAWLAEQWRGGRPDDQISYTLVPAPRPELAWQIAEVIRDRTTGRIIKIVNYGSAPDGTNVAPGGAATPRGGSSPAAPPNSSGNRASAGRTGSGPTGGAGQPPSGPGGARSPDSTTRVVNADGSNRVPGSPPTKPPAAPGGPNPPQWAPAPPVPTIPPVTPGRAVTQVPSTRRSDGTVYDPNITIRIDEDSPAADAARINAARAALDRARANGGVPVKEERLAVARAAAAARLDAHNRAGGVQTATKGPKADGGDPHHDAPAAPAGPQSFQPGDAAALIPQCQEGSISPYGSRYLNGHLEYAHGGRSFNIVDGQHIARRLVDYQQQWNPPKPQNDSDATVTLHAHRITPTEGIVHFVRDVHVNAEATDCVYRHYMVYRDFLIEYQHTEHQRVVHDVGRDWPTFLRNAQQLIDRRFPPVKNDAPAAQATPAAGDHHHGAPTPKPGDKKPHPLSGTWKMTAPGPNYPAGYTADVVITVNGGSIHIASTYNVPGSGTYSGTSDGTITGSEKGPYALNATTKGVASTASITVSADSSTMTITVLGSTSTLKRVQ